MPGPDGFPEKKLAPPPTELDGQPPFATVDTKETENALTSFLKKMEGGAM